MSISDIFTNMGVNIEVYTLDGLNISDNKKLDLSVINQLDNAVHVVGNQKFLKGTRYIYACSISQSDSVLKLADGFVENYLQTNKPSTLDSSLQSVFMGKSNIDIIELVNKFDIQKAHYVIINIVGAHKTDIIDLYPILDDIIVELDDSLAVIHYIDDVDDVKDFVMAFNDTVEQEVGKSFIYGVSQYKTSYHDLYIAFCEAKSSIEIHKMLNYKGNYVFYNDLLLERILVSIPSENRKAYYSRLFSPSNIKKLNAELMDTIDSFLTHDLNIAETSKHLYIHINTLAYRLKKINKIFGLDIKRFNDASIFKILLIMQKIDKYKGE